MRGSAGGALDLRASRASRRFRPPQPCGPPQLSAVDRPAAQPPNGVGPLRQLRQRWDSVSVVTGPTFRSLGLHRVPALESARCDRIVPVPIFALASPVLPMPLGLPLPVEVEVWHNGLNDSRKPTQVAPAQGRWRRDRVAGGTLAQRGRNSRNGSEPGTTRTEVVDILREPFQGRTSQPLRRAPGVAEAELRRGTRQDCSRTGAPPR